MNKTKASKKPSPNDTKNDPEQLYKAISELKNLFTLEINNLKNSQKDDKEELLKEVNLMIKSKKKLNKDSTLPPKALEQFK